MKQTLKEIEKLNQQLIKESNGKYSVKIVKESTNIDLSKKEGTLSYALTKHADELWKSFGTPPSYRDYDPTKIIQFIDHIRQKENVKLSNEKYHEILSNIKKFGHNGVRAVSYIANSILKGSNLSPV